MVLTFQKIIDYCCIFAMKITSCFLDRLENAYFLSCYAITSVCLIYYPASTPDSKKCSRDMKIPNIVSKTFTSPPIILKIFRSEISLMVEISTDFDLLGIIEFQIYGSILPIFQANLGKILAKILSSCIH